MGKKEEEALLKLDPVHNAMTRAVSTLLTGVGQDVEREGLQDTPMRHVKFLKAFCNPPGVEPDEDCFTFKTFKNDGSDYEAVIVSKIPFYSLCEHHLLPFFGTACIAYIPNERLAGLSKLPRTLNWFANQPQNQERITQQVMKFLMKKLETEDVAVMLKARHMCMEMRGVKAIGSETTTKAMSGVYARATQHRTDFISLANL